ncbi:MAG: TolB family protein [Pirellulaceae bacterium]
MTYSATSSNGRTWSVYVYDLLTDQTAEIFVTNLVSGDVNPRWSPPGVPERIAFKSAGLCTIAPNGTDLKVVYDAGTKSWSDYLRNPYWSPDGKYLVTENVLATMGKGGVSTYSYEIAVVPSQGGAKAILTADMPEADMRPLGWRWSTPAP